MISGRWKFASFQRTLNALTSLGGAGIYLQGQLPLGAIFIVVAISILGAYPMSMTTSVIVGYYLPPGTGSEYIFERILVLATRFILFGKTKVLMNSMWEIVGDCTKFAGTRCYNQEYLSK